MKYLRSLATLAVVCFLFSCSKSDSDYHDPTTVVGDTTFSGSYLEATIAERYYKEKEVWKLPGGLDTMVKVRLGDPDSVLWLSSLQYGSIFVKDSFATYRLGGHGHYSLAVMLRYNGKPEETGTFYIRSGYIYVDSVSSQMVYSSSGIVNVFHADTNYVQGTFSGNFALGGVEHSVNGTFKVFHPRRAW